MTPVGFRLPLQPRFCPGKTCISFLADSDLMNEIARDTTATTTAGLVVTVLHRQWFFYRNLALITLRDIADHTRCRSKADTAPSLVTSGAGLYARYPESFATLHSPDVYYGLLYDGRVILREVMTEELYTDSHKV